ncbi:MFS transporter [Iodidimonas nitroreducens]|uniref:MFS transporter n=1 Tax=Iodidimonas nitroreducens TaxID=1236968 RepID=A0A5A7NAC9_9PROT|nr:MFS transporter [Iodidimonas nitroreducens]GAK34357.1 putative transporter YybO [alpha proteobacterium Q-1]GER03936.1 MFS transporter [Iodidimonas nitroreducens]
MLIRLFIVLGPAYILSQFLRNSIAVLGPELSVSLDVGSAGLGTMTGAFFLGFAAMQLPVGMALDRFGPRRVMASFMIIVALGCAVFAMADDLFMLMAGRVLMGVGCAPLLMGAMVIFARAFEPDRFASLTSLQLAIGNSGILLATSPFALLIEQTGWRISLFGAAALACGFVILMLLALPESLRGRSLSSGRSEGLIQSLQGVGQILADRRLWPLMPLLFCGYGSVVSITALWGGPYLADIYGLQAVDRGNVLLLMASGSVIGPLCFGPLDRRFNSRKWIVVPGCGMVMAIFMLLAFWGRPPLWLLPGLFFLISAGTGYFSVAVAHARSLYSYETIGRGMTVSNMLVMGGVGILQPLSGLVARWFQGDMAPLDQMAALPENAYRAVFGFLGACLLLSLLSYLRAPDSKPFKPQEPPDPAFRPEHRDG